MTYKDHPGINISKLKYLAESPKLFKHMLDNPVDLETDATALGSLVHAMVLEPHKLSNYHIINSKVTIGGMLGTYIEELVRLEDEQIIPMSTEEMQRIAFDKAGFKIPFERVVKDAASDKAQAYYRELQVRKTKENCIDEALWNQAAEMHLAMKGDKHIQALLSRRTAELTELEIFWNRNDIALKSKIDMFLEEDGILIDLKTTSKRLSTFKEAFKVYRYDLQLAFYKLAIEEGLGKQVNKVLCIVVESKSPYDTIVYEIPDSAMTKATDEVKYLLDLYNAHRLTNIWQDLEYYNTGVKPLIIDELSHATRP